MLLPDDPDDPEFEPLPEPLFEPPVVPLIETCPLFASVEAGTA